MDELIRQIMQGVDPASPDAFQQMFANVWVLVPWSALLWWNVLFLGVGAALGKWRGCTGQGIAWAALLGPFGWLVVVLKKPRRSVQPPPLRR